MEIGGYDTIFDTANPAALAKEIMDFINWPSAVTETDESGAFFWYCDEEAKKRWDSGIGDPDIENDMIQFIVKDTYLAVITDQLLMQRIREKFLPGVVGS